MKLLSKFLKELFKKRTTNKYPFEKFPAQKGFRGIHEYNKNKCIFCGICEKVCPAIAIRVFKEKKIWKIDWGKCIFCSRCEENCPTNAIKLSKNYEKFSKNIEGLIYVR
jgi:formate hydrogenlyase subunit 6/NADH:ubiquinone oxidoreductase subunit I